MQSEWVEHDWYTMMLLEQAQKDPAYRRGLSSAIFVGFTVSRLERRMAITHFLTLRQKKSTKGQCMRPKPGSVKASTTSLVKARLLGTKLRLRLALEEKLKDSSLLAP